MLSACILIVFGADLKALDVFRETPHDKVVGQKWPLTKLLESLLAGPGFIQRLVASE